MEFEETEKGIFPYDHVRPIQDELLKRITTAVKSQQNLVVHAPTGLGKTAAALAPAIKEALDNDLTVFFLTSRHTQHKLAMSTIKDIKDKHKLNFFAVDIIGKKFLCLQPDVLKLSPRDFSDFCQKMREDDICDYYVNTRSKGEVSEKARAVVDRLKKEGKTDTKNIIEASHAAKLCPYEVALAVAKEATVIIGDYYYIFHPSIRESFMKRCGKELPKSIIIIDEGHNLPERVKDLATHRISSSIVSRALDEARRNHKDDLVEFLLTLENAINEAGRAIALHAERYIEKDELLEKLVKDFDFEEMLSEMEFVAGLVREEQKSSSIGTVSAFLEAWQHDAEGFTRILSKVPSLKGDIIVQVHYRCLDPALITREVIKSAHATILMSGTLSPTSMYREVLGFDSAVEETFKSPFKEENRLNIIVPKTSTKYETRNLAQYKEIAELVAKGTNRVPGNCAVFFPSYQLKDEVLNYFTKLSDKTVFSEKPKFTKSEKDEFLERFKQYQLAGAVLCGVIGGNFSEGIDLPGDYLKGVFIVGLPLQRPDLETEALIKYYDDKFKKGWDYGYLLPAFNKALQSAGRCIRTEDDKGVIVFIDERYAWKNYFRCFPPSWDIKITVLFERLIEEFFKKN